MSSYNTFHPNGTETFLNQLLQECKENKLSPQISEMIYQMFLVYNNKIQNEKEFKEDIKDPKNFMKYYTLGWYVNKLIENEKNTENVEK